MAELQVLPLAGVLMLVPTDHRRYVLGTIPFYPTLVLVATLYIIIKQHDLPGSVLSLLPI